MSKYSNRYRRLIACPHLLPSVRHDMDARIDELEDACRQEYEEAGDEVPPPSSLRGLAIKEFIKGHPVLERKGWSKGKQSFVFARGLGHDDAAADAAYHEYRSGISRAVERKKKEAGVMRHATNNNKTKKNKKRPRKI